ncbi:DUF6789 family protein [Achromobacter xylosoxidans]|uniref:DUF6789 family protein n=1 Tax=Alcaligenes xylosoxydans xylosoxydans TaxID=85698 RepID=UPI001F12AFD8|nr:DUF6789 family protein [Achromobacter xylosoxidans]
MPCHIRSMMAGWVAHFMIGAVLWGILFKLLYSKLPGGAALVKGMSFSVLLLATGVYQKIRNPRRELENGSGITTGGIEAHRSTGH